MAAIRFNRRQTCAADTSANAGSWPPISMQGFLVTHSRTLEAAFEKNFCLTDSTCSSNYSDTSDLQRQRYDADEIP